MAWQCVLLLLAGFAVSVRSQPGIGEACRLSSTGRFGTCKKPLDCPKARKIIENGGRPEICSYSGEDAIVCCADGDEDVDTTLSKEVRNSKSFKQCELYGKHVTRLIQLPTLLARPTFVNKTECSMPVANQLVINGIKARPQEFPHMSVLGFGTEDDISWLCGGTLISDRYVMTAGHCTWSREKGFVTYARLGDQNILSEKDDNYVQMIEIDNVINHPGYKFPVHYNDIALLHLKVAAEFTAGVRPACIHQIDTRTADDRVATVSGWGKRDNAGVFSDTLMKADLRLVSVENCSEHYENLIGTKKLGQGIDRVSMLCAGDPNRRQDTCQGDSGGPIQLILTEPYCMYGIIGITSFGTTACNGSPGVYTRVSRYRSWIESIVWPN